MINDHGLSALFEEVVLSADLGIVKPDPEIYLRTIQKLKLPAAHMTFVDDRKINVEAAEAYGMSGLVFSSTAAFIEDFEKLVGSSS